MPIQKKNFSVMAMARRLGKRMGFAETSLSTKLSASLLFFLVLLIGVFISCRWINIASVISNNDTVNMAQNLKIASISQIQSLPSQPLVRNSSLKPKGVTIIPFSCPTENHTTSATCMPRSLKSILGGDFLTSSSSCPNYFRWIHEDLRPWKVIGITEEMVNRARRTANFRLVIVNGKGYVEHYHKSFQSRDLFTLWGIVQLLRRYPGRVPDLDLMFDCVDWPIIQANSYRDRNALAPPPLFRYSGDDSTIDIVFPDWSFWGWPEINIKPWELLKQELKEGNDKVSWMNRDPYAYWKGNPAVATTRQELLQCNVSEGHDWNARIYAQDWLKESREGFKESDLANQCIHRYKIYIEGSAWSVSQKYILACNSLTLVVKPRYYDFFTRGFMPVQHYWPIKDDDKCRSIKFAVDWGNSHKQKAQAIGREASDFIQENLKMEYIYDYMFHLLNEYAQLLRYKPVIPESASELCAEALACPAQGIANKFMMDSLVITEHASSPCTLPPPYRAAELKRLLSMKANAIKQVEMWEQKAWDRQ